MRLDDFELRSFTLGAAVLCLGAAFWPHAPPPPEVLPPPPSIDVGSYAVLRGDAAHTLPCFTTPKEALGNTEPAWALDDSETVRVVIADEQTLKLRIPRKLLGASTSETRPYVLNECWVRRDEAVALLRVTDGP